MFQYCLLWAATDASGWRPGIGDPTPLGWFTVAAYLATAVLLASLWWTDRQRARNAQPASPAVWLLLALLFLGLALNKQLDLQSLMTQIGRRVALADGWYDNRREVQRRFIIGVLVAAVLSLLLLLWLGRRNLRRLSLVYVGLVALLAFIVIRGASFHRVDLFLGQRLGGIRFNGILELGAIALVAIGAALAFRPPDEPSGPIPLHFPTAPTPRR